MTAKSGFFDEYTVSDLSVDRLVRGLHIRWTESLLHSRPGNFFSEIVRRGSLAKRHKHSSIAGVCQEGVITELVARSKDGDTGAMEFLIKRYQGRIAGFVLAYVNDDQAVDDLCQTIFLKAITRLLYLKENAQFEAWLFRIARNTCFDHLRRRRLRRIFVSWRPEADQLPTSGQTVENGRVEAFRQALKLLPRKQRELVALLQDNQLSYEQLAEITKSSVSSVKSRLFRARRQLRRSLRNDV